MQERCIFRESLIRPLSGKAATERGEFTDGLKTVCFKTRLNQSFLATARMSSLRYMEVTGKGWNILVANQRGICG